MFEDSTFESTGRIHTGSRGWIIVTFTLNASILLALLLIPLVYPEALPRIASAILMAVSPPADEPKPLMRLEHTPATPSQLQAEILLAPSRIPHQPYIPGRPEQPMNDTVVALGGASTGSSDGVFHGPSTQPIIVEAPRAAQHVSSGVMQGKLVYKVVPRYPALARAMHVSGTVVLQASISRSGTIANLRVASGPAMLQQAALDAVEKWRYQPYLLNGQPVEVETTVNVDFAMQ